MNIVEDRVCTNEYCKWNSKKRNAKYCSDCIRYVQEKYPIEKRETIENELFRIKSDTIIDEILDNWSNSINIKQMINIDMKKILSDLFICHYNTLNTEDENIFVKQKCEYHDDYKTYIMFMFYKNTPISDDELLFKIKKDNKIKSNDIKKENKRKLEQEKQFIKLVLKNEKKVVEILKEKGKI